MVIWSTLFHQPEALSFAIASFWSFPPRSLYLLGNKVINYSLLTTLCISAAPCEKVITRGAADDAELQLGLELVVQGDIFQSCNISILPNYENVKLSSVSYKLGLFSQYLKYNSTHRAQFQLVLLFPFSSGTLTTTVTSLSLKGQTWWERV